MNVYFKELKAYRKSIIIWSISMILLIFMAFEKYDALALGGEETADFLEIINQMPKFLQAIMGLSNFDITTPIGYSAVMYIYLVLMGAIHAGMIGAGIITKEEKEKTVEFLMVKPITRFKIVKNKMLVALTNVVIFNIITFVSLLLVLIWKNVFTYNIIGDLGLLMLGILFVQILFLTIGFSFALMKKKYKQAASLTMVILLSSYFLSMIIDVVPDLKFLSVLTPFKYYDAKGLLDNGLNIWYLLLTMFLIVVLLTIGIKKYQQRDLNI